MIYLNYTKESNCNSCNKVSRSNFLVFTKICKNKRIYCYDCINNRNDLKDLCKLQLDNLSFFDYKIVESNGNKLFSCQDNILEILKDIKKFNITFKDTKHMDLYIPVKQKLNPFYISLNLNSFEKNLNRNDLNYLRKINNIIVNTTVLTDFKIRLIILGSIFDKSSLFYNLPIDITKLIISNFFYSNSPS